MSHKSLLVASLMRQRPDAPGALRECLASLASLEWPGERSTYLLVHDDGTAGHWWQPDQLGEVVRVASAPDSRDIGGPRSTGETQEVLAFLRNRILRRFQTSWADLLLMVDSDIVLAPGAALALAELAGSAATASLQIDNRLDETHQPASNGTCRVESEGAWIYHRAPYATDGSVIEVARAGACTMYPRAVLRRRFHWEPGLVDEQDSLCDALRGDGFSHYLLRDPQLAEHRMRRGNFVRDSQEWFQRHRENQGCS